MKPAPWLSLAALLAGACSDDTTGPEPAELAELCGQEGPVQILALDPDRPLARVGDRGIFGERRVLQVEYVGEADDDLGEHEVWSVGLCGEDPRLIAEGDIYVIRYLDIWPELLFECDAATGRISTLDPLGVQSANVVFETDDCSSRPLDEGLLTVVANDDDATASLILQPWLNDPWTESAESVVLHDSLRSPVNVSLVGDVGVGDDELFVITADDELVAISRVDGAPTTIATNVAAARQSRSGRYVFWQDAQLTNADPRIPEGAMFLLDRQTDEVLELGEGRTEATYLNEFQLESLGFFHVTLGEDSDGVHRFVRLATFESFDVPIDLFVHGAIDDTRVLVGGWWFTAPFWIFDTTTAELTMLFDGDGTVRDMDEARFDLLERSSSDASKLRRVPYQGEPTLLARRATDGYWLTSDGRVVTPIDADADFVGKLIVVDPATLDEQIIDDHVLRYQPTPIDDFEGDPVVLYAVADRERQGVWIARLEKP
ncbi:hypothetical protein ACNOYE_08285 [Nannocystaceae bacterium ST9]